MPQRPVPMCTNHHNMTKINTDRGFPYTKEESLAMHESSPITQWTEICFLLFAWFEPVPLDKRPSCIHLHHESRHPSRQFEQTLQTLTHQLHREHTHTLRNTPTPICGTVTAIRHCVCACVYVCYRVCVVWVCTCACACVPILLTTTGRILSKHRKQNKSKK